MPANLDQKGDRLLENGKDVGMLETHVTGDKLEIDRLYLDKENQRRGIGKQVLPYLFAAHPDINKIEVYPGGKSEPFWLKQKPTSSTEDRALVFERPQFMPSDTYSWMKPDGSVVPVEKNHGTTALQYFKHNTAGEAIESAWSKGWLRVANQGDDLYVHTESGTPSAKQVVALKSVAIENGKTRIVLDSGPDHKVLWTENDAMFMPAGNDILGTVKNGDEVTLRPLPAGSDKDHAALGLRGDKFRYNTATNRVTWTDLREEVTPAVRRAAQEQLERKGYRVAGHEDWSGRPYGSSVFAGLPGPKR